MPGKFLLPGYQELPLVIGAVSQIELDQGLVGDTFGFRQRLEIVEGAAIDADGDLHLQSARMRVLP